MSIEEKMIGTTNSYPDTDTSDRPPHIQKLLIAGYRRMSPQQIKNEHIPKPVNAFDTEFYIDAGMIREAFQHRILFNIIHLATMFKVDTLDLRAIAYEPVQMGEITQ